MSTVSVRALSASCQDVNISAMPVVFS